MDTYTFARFGGSDISDIVSLDQVVNNQDLSSFCERKEKYFPGLPMFAKYAVLVDACP